MEEGTALKDRANALFAQKQFDQALGVYDEALRAASKEKASPELKDLRCTLLTNRATCLYQLARFQECVEECTEALNLDGRRVKTLYRRAQAYEELGKLEDALADLRIAVEPTNKAAVSTARRVREALARQVQSRTPVVQALEVLKKEGEGAKERQRALHSLVGLTAEDASAAVEVLEKGGLSLLWPLIKNGPPGSSEALDALHVLAACCHHPSFVTRAFNPSTEEGAAALKDLQAVTAPPEQESALAMAGVMTMLRVAKGWMAGKGTQPQGGREQVSSAVLAGWTQSLKHQKREVRMAGLEAMVTWLAMADETDKDHHEVLHSLEGETLKRLVSLLDGKDPGERQKAALALGRLWALIKASPDRIKSIFLQLVPEPGRPPAITEGGAMAPPPDLRSCERVLLLITALAYADNELAIWALQEEEPPSGDQSDEKKRAEGRGHVHTLALLATSPAETAQEISAELANQVMSSEAGRTLLGNLVASAPFLRLLDSPASAVRAAAASAYTKLGLAAKALPSASSDLTRLLNVAADELRAAPAEGSGEERSLERAVEVLSCLVTRTTLKDEIAFGSGRCVATLPLLLNKVKDGRSPSSYGLSFILSSLALSVDELRKEALAERDVTPEQYEQIQKLQKMQTPKGQGEEEGPSEEALEADPPERVQKRIREMVKLGGIRALCKLCGQGAGAATMEQAAMAFAEIAVVEDLRGPMIQQGGYAACLELAGEGHGDKTRAKATHAAAKCLVTTNPHVLSERQRMGAVVPLLWLCRYNAATNLQQFEALLALTNLASVGDQVRNAIAANKGVPALQYLQYTDHPMVRRAATEALCNMANHPDGIANFRSAEKLRIWMALADDYEDDAATAQAAMGALATAAADEGVSEALSLCEGGIDRLTAIVQSKPVNMVYRAAVCIGYMVAFDKPRERLKEAGMLRTLQALKLDQLPEEVGSAVMFAIETLLQAKPPPPPSS